MQNSYVVILAVGMLLCILTGGNIDLSVGSVVCLVGAVCGVLMAQLHLNMYLVMGICLLIGLLIGAWQGFWIAYVRIPPFIVTLAGMLLFRGLAQQCSATYDFRASEGTCACLTINLLSRNLDRRRTAFAIPQSPSARFVAVL